MTRPFLPRFAGLLAFVSLLLTLTVSAAFAQNAPRFTLELNNAADTDQGGCRLTYVAVNQSGQALAQTAYQVGVFDSEGIVRRILVLEFGALLDGKTKIVLFDLADQSCSEISRIIVNDVAECTLAADGSPADFCLTGLATNSRTVIQFGT